MKTGVSVGFAYRSFPAVALHVVDSLFEEYLARLAEDVAQDDIWFGLALCLHFSALAILESQVDTIYNHLVNLELQGVPFQSSASHLFLRS